LFTFGRVGGQQSNPAILAQWEVAMSSLCKLMDLTGPLAFPTTVALGIVRGGERFQIAKVILTPNDEIQMTLFEFDDQELIPFDSQLELGLNAAGPGQGGQDLGATVINAGDSSQGETTTRFHPAGINGPFYDLTYKVLPG
jgi:hypothetical protein